MNRREMTVKKPRLKRDWEGRYVRLKRKMETKGGDVFEAGEVMRVDRNYGGLHLSAVRHCSECKKRYRGHLRKVQERDVMLLPEDYRPESEGGLFSVYALRAEVERLKALAICSSDEGTHVYWSAVAQAQGADLEELKGELEWRENELTKAEDEIAAYEHEVEDLRAEVERLRRACVQVRKWGIELASLPPEEREQRFCQLWPHINDALRTAALQTDPEDSQC
jgi:hypothetical protein